MKRGTLGVPYAAPWGHRGATHSLTLSLALGLVVGFAARWGKVPAIRTAFTASAVGNHRSDRQWS